jgi:hypothetical protein
MPEESSIFKGKLKHSGIFDFKDMYKFAYNLLKEGKGLAVIEKTYSEKVGPNGKDIEVEWEGTKTISDYFKIKVVAKTKVMGLTNVEAEKDGKKVKLNKGDLEVNTEGKITRDYEGKWEKSPFMKFTRSIYDKYIIKNKITEVEEALARDCDDFLAQLKAFLSLEAKR